MSNCCNQSDNVGLNGYNAFTTLAVKFTIPPIGEEGILYVSNTRPDTGMWAARNQIINVNGNYFKVINSTHGQIKIINEFIDSNLPPGAILPVGSKISGAGPQGRPGSSGASTSDEVSNESGVPGENVTEALDYLANTIFNTPVSSFKKDDFASTATYTIPDSASSNHILIFSTSENVNWVSLTINGYTDPLDGAIVQLRVYTDGGTLNFNGISESDFKKGLYTYRFINDGIIPGEWIRVDYDNSSGSSGPPVVQDLDDPNTTDVISTEGLANVIDEAIGEAVDEANDYTDDNTVVDGDTIIGSGTTLDPWRVNFTVPEILIKNTVYPFVERRFKSGNAPSAILKVLSSNMLFVANGTGNTVSVFDITNGAVTSYSVSGPSAILYVEKGVSNSPEIWVLGTATKVYKYNPTTGAYLGEETMVSFPAGIKAVVDRSNASGVVYAASSTTMYIITVATMTFTTVAITGGVNSFQMIYMDAPLSPHDKYIIGCTGSPGIWAFDTVSGTMKIASTNLSGAVTGAMSVKYIPSLDKYIFTCYNSDSVVLVNAATSTTFTVSSSVLSLNQPSSVEIDDTDKVAYIFSSQGGSNTPVTLYLVDYSTGTLLSINDRTLPVNTSTFVFSSIDLVGKAIYCVGNTGSSVVSKTIIKS